MTPNERHFKREYAEELLKVAESDLDSAQILASASKGRPENALDHVGQCVEKLLKAVLCAAGETVPLTPDIYAIVQKFGETDRPPGGFTLHDLTPFTTVRRYEEGRDIIEKEEVQNAIKLAEEVRQWAIAKISSK